MKLSAVKFARYLLTVSVTLNIFSQTTLGAIFTQNHRSTTETTFVDPRSALDRNKTPALNAIGIIDVSGQSNVVSKKPSPELLKAFRPGLQVGRGSGFLINACLVVTNHHVAFIARDKNQITDIKIQFTIPSIKTTYEGIIIDSGNYKSN